MLTIRNIKVCLILLFGAIATAGCSSNRTDGLDEATLAYDRGADLEVITLLEQSPPLAGERRAQGLYLEGMARSRRAEWSLARRAFEQAAASSQQETGHRAAAMGGQLAWRARDRSAAIRLLSRAQEHLGGADGMRAASLLRQIQGGDVTPSASTGLFTLQFGAFHDRNRAADAVRRWQNELGSMALGDVRIVEKTSSDSGRAMFLVQAGVFATRQAATAARTSIGTTRCMVVSGIR